jgi:hypothetical protein
MRMRLAGGRWSSGRTREWRWQAEGNSRMYSEVELADGGAGCGGSGHALMREDVVAATAGEA